MSSNGAPGSTSPDERRTPTPDHTGASSPSERARAVHIRFPSSQGARLRRTEPTSCGDGSPLWIERPILAQRADGTYELFGSSDNLDGLARWVLSYGADAEVCGPRALQRRVVSEAQRVIMLYSDESPS